jgi:hypothetical protein
MTNKENIYLSKAEVKLYNKTHDDILKTKNADSIEVLKNNAFNLLNNAMYRHFKNT